MLSLAAMGVDHYSKQEMIGLGITFLFLPCIFVGFRIWAKWLSRRSLQADDYLIFRGLVSPFHYVYITRL